MAETALDFSRYAPARPARPALAYAVGAATPAPILPADTLSEAFAVAGFAARAFCRSLGIAASIMRRRLTGWVEDWFHRVMQSPLIAWSFGGVGWGGFIGVCLLLHFTR